jgi:hypothetical protein
MQRQPESDSRASHVPSARRTVCDFCGAGRVQPQDVELHALAPSAHGFPEMGARTERTRPAQVEARRRAVAQRDRQHGHALCKRVRLLERTSHAEGRTPTKAPLRKVTTQPPPPVVPSGNTSTGGSAQPEPGNAARAASAAARPLGARLASPPAAGASAVDADSSFSRMSLCTTPTTPQALATGPTMGQSSRSWRATALYGPKTAAQNTMSM